MKHRLSLQGIRLHIAGSIPADATVDQATGIGLLTERLARAVLREGGSLIHGSHPSLEPHLRSAAVPFVAAGGSRDGLVLVRARKYAITAEQLAHVDAQREYSTVQIIPSAVDDEDQTLVPMREWMAERCDVVVAIGGDHWSINPARSGVAQELEEALSRGKPGFIVGGFGGAAAGYATESDTVFRRLRNGMSLAENRALALSSDIDAIVKRIIAQVQLLPLTRENTQGGRLFRILALDGGGLRGTFAAAVLAKWDDMIKSGGENQIVKHFDLVAGTSTGAILAIGLGLGLAPRAMLEFYRAQGPKIFPKDRRLRHWFKSKHDSATLRSILESVFGSRTLTLDSCCRLVIPTVRASHGESEVIVTAHSPDRTAFADMAAVEAALASSAAPTYFDEAVWDGPIAMQSFLDGGIWANNPVLPAIAEAVRHLRIPMDRIDVLSVGTTSSELDFSESLGKGKAGWAPSSADLFFAAQEHAAARLADDFLSRSRHLRVNQQTPNAFELDNREVIEDLARRGECIGQDSFQIVRSRFLDGLHAPDWRSES